MKYYRPLVMKMTHLEKIEGRNSLVDYYYPSFYSKEKKARIYFAEGRKILRFKSRDEAQVWLAVKGKKGG